MTDKSGKSNHLSEETVDQIIRNHKNKRTSSDSVSTLIRSHDLTSMQCFRIARTGIPEHLSLLLKHQKTKLEA